MPVRETIKYEADRDKAFARWIEGVVGGERISHCIQCGTCSAVCPVSRYMDFTPRRLVHLSKEGFKEEVLGSFAIWLCASCYACTTACPKEIKVTEILYMLKRRAIQERIYPRRFPIPVLARYFYMFVRATGRTSEMWLVMLVFLRTNVFKMLGMSMLGFHLLRTGRMSLKLEMLKGRSLFRKFLDSAGSDKEVAPR